MSENFLITNKLTKSTMKLVDEDEFKKLLKDLKIEKTISGGSVANSIVGLAQLGNEVGFIGKVNDDDLGKEYLEGLSREGKISLQLKDRKNSNWYLFDFNNPRLRKNNVYFSRYCRKNK